MVVRRLTIYIKPQWKEKTQTEMIKRDGYSKYYKEQRKRGGDQAERERERLCVCVCCQM